MTLPSSTYDTATLVNPGSSLTDFTLVVDLSRMSAAWWSAVDTSDGTKGRAAKDSGPAELPCDWIDFDSVNETGLLRVKWSGTLLTGATTQTLRIYPPQDANASVAANATYGSDNAYDSDWAAYWPLHDVNDRTVNGYHLTANGGVSLGGVPGKIGFATDFDGVDDWLSRTSSAPAMGPDKTLMAWVAEDSGTVTRVVTISDSISGSYQQLLPVFQIWRAQEYDGSNRGEATNSLPRSYGTWYQLTGQFVATNSRYAWTNKGKTQNTTNIDSTGSGGNRLGIARALWGGNTVNGKIQHVQAHSVARSDDWIEYEYDQMEDQATFWGTWTNVPGSPAVTTKAYWWG